MPPVVVIGARVVVGGAAGEQVVDGDEHRVGHEDNDLRVAAVRHDVAAAQGERALGGAGSGFERCFDQGSDELRAQFPNIVAMQRPKGWGQSLYWGDEDYERHRERNPAWKIVHDVIHSQDWVDYIIEQFGEYWKREGCVVDLSKVRYVPYCESRADKERFHLEKVEYEPHDLWCRLYFYQSYAGYYRPVHLDHRRRLMSMLVYFEDHDAAGMTGGELILHPPGLDLALLAKMGVFHAPKPFSLPRDRFARTIAVKPKNNRMVVFTCGRTSWHSVHAVQPARAPRQHIQITISSSVDAWR